MRKKTYTFLLGGALAAFAAYAASEVAGPGQVGSQDYTYDAYKFDNDNHPVTITATYDEATNQVKLNAEFPAKGLGQVTGTSDWNDDVAFPTTDDYEYTVVYQLSNITDPDGNVTYPSQEIGSVYATPGNETGEITAEYTNWQPGYTYSISAKGWIGASTSSSTAWAADFTVPVPAPTGKTMEVISIYGTSVYVTLTQEGDDENILTGTYQHAYTNLTFLLKDGDGQKWEPSDAPSSTGCLAISSVPSESNMRKMTEGYYWQLQNANATLYKFTVDLNNNTLTVADANASAYPEVMYLYDTKNSQMVKEMTPVEGQEGVYSCKYKNTSGSYLECVVSPNSDSATGAYRPVNVSSSGLQSVYNLPATAMACEVDDEVTNRWNIQKMDLTLVYTFDMVNGTLSVEEPPFVLPNELYAITKEGQIIGTPNNIAAGDIVTSGIMMKWNNIASTGFYFTDKVVENADNTFAPAEDAVIIGPTYNVNFYNNNLFHGDTTGTTYTLQEFNGKYYFNTNYSYFGYVSVNVTEDKKCTFTTLMPLETVMDSGELITPATYDEEKGVVNVSAYLPKHLTLMEDGEVDNEGDLPASRTMTVQLYRYEGDSETGLLIGGKYSQAPGAKVEFVNDNETESKALALGATYTYKLRVKLTYFYNCDSEGNEATEYVMDIDAGTVTIPSPYPANLYQIYPTQYGLGSVAFTTTAPGKYTATIKATTNNRAFFLANEVITTSTTDYEGKTYHPAEGRTTIEGLALGNSFEGNVAAYYNDPETDKDNNFEWVIDSYLIDYKYTIDVDLIENTIKVTPADNLPELVLLTRPVELKAEYNTATGKVTVKGNAPYEGFYAAKSVYEEKGVAGILANVQLDEDGEEYCPDILVDGVSLPAQVSATLWNGETSLGTVTVKRGDSMTFEFDGALGDEFNLSLTGGDADNTYAISGTLDYTVTKPLPYIPTGNINLSCTKGWSYTQIYLKKSDANPNVYVFLSKPYYNIVSEWSAKSWSQFIISEGGWFVNQNTDYCWLPSENTTVEMGETYNLNEPQKGYTITSVPAWTAPNEMAYVLVDLENLTMVFRYQPDAVMVNVSKDKANKKVVATWDPATSKNQGVTVEGYNVKMYNAEGEVIAENEELITGTSYEFDYPEIGNGYTVVVETVYSDGVVAESEAASFDLTRVEGLFIDDADVEYYDLQGNRVVNPENGIYIRRTNGQVEKVLVK